VLFSLLQIQLIMILDATRPAAKEYVAMVFDLILAVAFLAMIIAPAVVTMPSHRSERDSL